MNIGYIGLGDMGGALATRIASRHALHVYDKSDDAVAALVSKGGTASESIADLGKTCKVVLLCLPTSKHVHSVIFGDGGLVGCLSPGSLIIDQTSGNPSETRAMADGLAARGIDLVDAPVSGGAPAALAGTISMMLGAPERAVARAREVLGLIGDNVTHIGPVGTGHTMKLVNNLLSCTQRLLTLEALALVAKKGIDPVLAVDVLCKGGGRNAFLEVQARTVLSGAIDRDGGFSLALAHKDLKLACDVASEAEVPTFYGSLSRDLYGLAVSQLGGGKSVDTIADLMEAAARVKLIGG